MHTNGQPGGVWYHVSDKALSYSWAHMSGFAGAMHATASGGSCRAATLMHAAPMVRAVPKTSSEAYMSGHGGGIMDTLGKVFGKVGSTLGNFFSKPGVQKVASQLAETGVKYLDSRLNKAPMPLGPNQVVPGQDAPHLARGPSIDHNGFPIVPKFVPRGPRAFGGSKRKRPFAGGVF